MNEPTTDEKIQLLVRSVLEAVDSRLDAVRHEVAAFAAEVEQRHHQVLGTMAAMERRIADLERADEHRRTSTGTVAERLDEMGARLDLLARVATERLAPTPAHGMPMPDPHPPLTAPSVPRPAPAPTVPAADPGHGGDLSAISKPLIDHSHVTTQIPIVPDPSIQRLTSLPLPAAVTPTMGATHVPPHEEVHMETRTEAPDTLHDGDVHDDAAHDGDVHHGEVHDGDLHDGDIDLEQLSALLAERLGHLSMPSPGFPESHPE